MKGHADSRRGGLRWPRRSGITGEGFTRRAGAVPRFGGLRGWRSRAGTVPAPARTGASAVAPASVEVGGEVGQLVEAGHPGGGGDRPDHGGVAGSVPVMGAAGVLPGHDRAPDRSFRDVIVQADQRVAAVRGQPVPFPVQGGERLLRGLGQARGLRCFFLVRRSRRARRPTPGRPSQPGRGRGFLLRGGRGGLLPGGRELVVSAVQVPDPVQPRLRPALQLGGVLSPARTKYLRIMRSLSNFLCKLRQSLSFVI